jgi:hypothetical protein
MTVVDGALVVFDLLMVCAFWLTADRKFSDGLGQDERCRADAAVQDRACARDGGGREFWPEVGGNCGSDRPA